MKAKDLSIRHPYYCSDNNYSDSKAQVRFDTASEFLAEYGDADIDLNLFFRWDVSEIEEGTGRYCAEVFCIKQRKGIFQPIQISRIFDDEADAFAALMSKHLQRLIEMWKPLSIN